MMKLMTFAAAAAIALGGLTAAPALAQPPGHDMRGDSMRHDDNDRHDRDMNRGDNGRHEGWERGRHNGWNNHHRRQVCRWTWRHHHRQRVCTWVRR
jgi:hypothetical protein